MHYYLLIIFLLVCQHPIRLPHSRLFISTSSSFLHPPRSNIATARASLVEARRIYLTLPTERNRYTFLRNTCNGLESSPTPEPFPEEMDAIQRTSNMLEAICDNGLCAKRESQSPGEEKLLKCSGCGWARYCSRDCQKRCWKRHKSVCVSLAVLTLTVKLECGRCH